MSESDHTVVIAGDGSLGIAQIQIERIMADWIAELPVRTYYGREVTGFAQDATGVVVQFADSEALRAEYLAGCDGGRSVVRKTTGIDFAGWDATRSNLIAEVEVTEEPPRGIRHDATGVHAFRPMDDARTFGVVVTEAQLGSSSEPTKRSSKCTAPILESTTPPGFPGSPT